MKKEVEEALAKLEKCSLYYEGGQCRSWLNKQKKRNRILKPIKQALREHEERWGELRARLQEVADRSHGQYWEGLIRALNVMFDIDQKRLREEKTPNRWTFPEYLKAIGRTQ